MWIYLVSGALRFKKLVLKKSHVLSGYYEYEGRDTHMPQLSWNRNIQLMMWNWTATIRDGQVSN
jgi:hypothetical protein